MNIGIDGNEANVLEPVGVSVYTLNLLLFFQKNSGPLLSFVVFLREKPKAILPKQTNYFRYEVVSGKKLWSQIFLPLRLLKFPNLDVFFAPAHYAPRHLSIPLVVTIHDLAYFYYPAEFLKKDLYKLKNWTKQSVNKSKKIIAVSQNTKVDLIQFYNTQENKISVIYNGFEKASEKNDHTRIDTGHATMTNQPYILYVGTLQPRKNISTLIHAFSKFVIHNSEFKLVIVGKKGWLYDKIFSLVEELKLNEKIIFAGHISDAKLAQLYKNAFCFVMPSLYEGFGIPLLEAMSYGCPVISSNASSLPEVGGDACLYFDPKDENKLLKQMTILSENKILREDLIDKGRKQIKKFSWEKCARETLVVLKSAL